MGYLPEVMLICSPSVRVALASFYWLSRGGRRNYDRCTAAVVLVAQGSVDLPNG